MMAGLRAIAFGLLVLAATWSADPVVAVDVAPSSARPVLSRVCVDDRELAAMPRTTKPAIEKVLGQRGVRDRSYEAFAEDFGFDVSNLRMFTYPRCGGRGKLEVVYEVRPRSRAWPIVYSAYSGPYVP